MRKTWVLTLLLLTGAFILATKTVEVWADGNEKLGTPSISIKSGSGMVSAGTGLEVQPGTININVPFGATIKQALLYWGCKGSGDSSIFLNNSALNGTLIGSSSRGAAFRADITGLGLIGNGPNELTIDGLNCGTASNGASALVIFDQKVEAVEFSGEATVLDAFVNITGLQIDATEVTAGPLPPEGGSDSDSVANLNVGNGAITSGTATASTVGAGNQSFSEAEVEDLNINLLNLLLVGGSVIKAEAEATCDADGNASVSGNSILADLFATLGGAAVNIPASFPPNTVLANLNIAGLGQVKIVVNEQIGSAIGGQGEITVNALHITSTVNIPLVGTETVADIVISSAHADINCEVITPPVI